MKARTLLTAAGLALVLGSAGCAGQASTRTASVAGCADGDCCAPAAERCVAACDGDEVMSRRDCRETCALEAASCSAAQPDGAARVALYQDLGRIAGVACGCSEPACRERALSELGAWGQKAYGVPSTSKQQAFAAQTIERVLSCVRGAPEQAAMAAGKR